MDRDIPESLRSERTHLGGSFVDKGMDGEGEGMEVGEGGEGGIGAKMDGEGCMSNGQAQEMGMGLEKKKMMERIHLEFQKETHQI